MVEVVNKSQQVVTAGLAPKSDYSRQVCLDLKAKKGSGEADMRVTSGLGSRVWLLGVDIWFMNYTVDVPTKGWIVIAKGSGKKPTPSDVVNRWEHILPVVGVVEKWIQWFGIRGHRHYSMRRLFQGEVNRFAAYIENKQDLIDWYVHVSFEISEG